MERFRVVKSWTVDAERPTEALAKAGEREPDSVSALPMPSREYGGTNWYQPQVALDAAWDLYMDLVAAGDLGDDPQYKPPSLVELTLAGLDPRAFSMFFDIAITAYQRRPR